LGKQFLTERKRDNNKEKVNLPNNKENLIVPDREEKANESHKEEKVNMFFENCYFNLRFNSRIKYSTILPLIFNN
jgi:hypothetical protein